MEFRKQALSKLQSPEELDLPVRFARPQGWLVLAVTLIVMAVGAFWAVTGTVSSTLRATGVLTHGQGSYVLQSPVAGQVTAVLAAAGKTLPAHAPLLKVHTAQGDNVIRTIDAGRVTTLTVTIGAVVTTGANVATLERVNRSDAPLMALIYVPQDSAPGVPVGATVDLTVQSVSTDRYGTLNGRVKSVGTAPQTRQQITEFLGDAQLGADFTSDGRPIPVLVQLDTSSTTKSGYRWSSSQGPPFALDSMIGTSAAIRLARQHPVDWLLP
ncbi:HlyD family efflux transporter periplasmic adaptor subunit [Streptomyces odontomachi]|uniref:HlyD family efflux transporter periplasmic adaptor subunit n=1 Tax=Streptomyces odontomachi TaxID=2944940 RepID=UPI00210D9EF5|nr:HlyD family efflux transporter periplasmic adaptor subunit [Streptomyces sp. ODS25]